MKKQATQTLTRTIGEGVGWLSFSTLLLKGMGLVTMFVILNNLTVYQYGVIELVQSILPIMSIFLLPGLSTLIITDMGIEKDRGDLPRLKGIFLAYAKICISLGVLAWAERNGYAVLGVDLWIRGTRGNPVYPESSFDHFEASEQPSDLPWNEVVSLSCQEATDFVRSFQWSEDRNPKREEEPLFNLWLTREQ